MTDALVFCFFGTSWVCWLADKWWALKRRRCSVVIPAVREQQETNPHVHQQPRSCCAVCVTSAYSLHALIWN